MKYEYKILEQQKDESDVAFLARVNESGLEGFRLIKEVVIDSENNTRVLMEKEFHAQN